jgi:hypothetical protein
VTIKERAFAMSRATISSLAAENNIARSVALLHLNDTGILRDPTNLTFDYNEASAAIKLRLDEARIKGNRVAGGPHRAVLRHRRDAESDKLDLGYPFKRS